MIDFSFKPSPAHFLVEVTGQSICLFSKLTHKFLLAYEKTLTILYYQKNLFFAFTSKFLGDFER